MKKVGKAKATRERPTMARSRSLPLNKAAVMPNSTPPVIQMTKAEMASDTETGSLSLMQGVDGLAVAVGVAEAALGAVDDLLGGSRRAAPRRRGTRGPLTKPLANFAHCS